MSGSLLDHIMGMWNDRTKKWLIPAAICLVSLILVRNFFEVFPNGWDQAEYAWCLRQNYLPHSPYILHFLLGKVFYWIFGDAAVALSVLSTCAGIASLVLLYQVTLRLFTSEEGSDSRAGTIVVTASFAIALMGTNYLFIRQSGTQEVYVLQLFFNLLAAYLILDRDHDGTALGGAAYGCALATHSGSLFLLPSLLVAAVVASQWRGQSWVRAVFKTFSVTALTVLGFCAVIYILLPSSGDGHQWAYYFTYLRGIAGGVNVAGLSDWSLLQKSLQGLMLRLTNTDIPHQQGPAEMHSIGLTVLHLLAATAGVILAFRRNWKATVFWLFWIVPYLGYEVLKGQTPDIGVYAVYVLPPVMTFLGVVVTWCIVSSPALPGPARWIKGPVIWLVAIGLLGWPSFAQLKQHWHDPEMTAAGHFTAARLAAIGASKVLPGDAIVIQPRSEWNVNVFPYYTRRRPIQHQGGWFYILKDLGKFTPMNGRSYEFLEIYKLVGILRSGTPVYAFEADPLSFWTGSEELGFQWQANVRIDLDTVVAHLGISADEAQQLPHGKFTLYKGSYNTNR